MIKAPYNFVPLNKEVVIPDWGPFISHDIPFEYSVSGSFNVTVYAHSPVFVRNGIRDKNENVPEDTSFFNFNNNYFIPGSSLRGMIRNVLEIMTFSKLGNKVDDNNYAIRDLSPAAKPIYLNYFKPEEIFCGWLQKIGGKYQLEDCGIPGRISHKNLNHTFADFYKRGGGYLETEKKHKSAEFKYEKFRLLGGKLINCFKFITTDSGLRKIYEIDNSGQEGTIVFTGQPSPSFIKEGVRPGKHLEFIFLKNANPEPQTIDEKLIKDFFFAYFDHENESQQSIDWIYWSKKLILGEKIPVFFLKNGINPSCLGLSYLFKLPYQNSVVQSIKKLQTEEGIDMSEAIFGYVNDDNKNALKSRVHIGHAKATNTLTFCEVAKEVLSSPRASYYPNYIRQKGEDGKTKKYNTFMDDKPEISGWKRYPVRSNSNITRNDVVENMASSFRAADTGSTFNFTVSFHNLKKIELGALLSTVTFHNNSDSYFHSLGLAKPLGYGKVSLKIADLKIIGEKINYHAVLFMKFFETFMNFKLISENWICESVINELFTMASGQGIENDLEYMKLKNNDGENEFVLAKNANEYLKKFSELNNIVSRPPNSLLNQNDDSIKSEILSNTKKYKLLKSTQELFEIEKNIFNNDLKLLIEKHKNSIHQKVLTRQAEIANIELKGQEQDREIKRLELANKAKEHGIDYSKVKIGDREAFKSLSKAVEVFVVSINKKLAYEKCVSEQPHGVIPELYQPELIDMIKEIYGGIKSRNDRAKWKEPLEGNHIFKKTANWIGKEKSLELLNSL